MTRPLPFRRVERALLALGFRRVRQRGSHVFFEHRDGRRAIVPHHAGADVKRGTLRAILRAIDVPWAEFERHA
jgi:predicted RNA binding protein YcfA (HicA-like mRNA interferase family)